MIQIPQIDLGPIVPVLGLAAIAVMCILALIAVVLLRSRIALLIAVVIGVVVAGPALAGALVNIVWALVPLGVVVIAGILAGLWVLSRNPDLLALVRDFVPRKAAPPAQVQPPLALTNSASRAVIDQPAQAIAPRQTVHKTTSIDRDRWGF
jgi:hypothetical protein